MSCKKSLNLLNFTSYNNLGPRSQVVRQGSAKPLCGGSIPPVASSLRRQAKTVIRSFSEG